tara:strand:- start:542 stop:898 length:357 start_codon:yes stop_codon:yes gene_type:complete
MKEENRHSKYYYEKDRNIWTETSTDNLQNTTEDPTFSSSLDKVSKKVTDLLKTKNKAYGNTALNPPKIFSKLESTEAICARIDDKLSRIQNRGINDATEDTVDDLIGYLFLLKMSMLK